MANVLVFAETRGTALRKTALEAVTAARAFVDAIGGGEVHALVAGPSGVGATASQLGEHGADGHPQSQFGHARRHHVGEQAE